MAILTAVKADSLSDIPQLEWMIRDKLPKMSAFNFAVGHGKFIRNHSNFFTTPPLTQQYSLIWLSFPILQWY